MNQYCKGTVFSAKYKINRQKNPSQVVLRGIYSYLSTAFLSEKSVCLCLEGYLLTLAGDIDVALLRSLHLSSFQVEVDEFGVVAIEGHAVDAGRLYHVDVDVSTQVAAVLGGGGHLHDTGGEGFQDAALIHGGDGGVLALPSHVAHRGVLRSEHGVEQEIAAYLHALLGCTNIDVLCQYVHITRDGNLIAEVGTIEGNHSDDHVALAALCRQQTALADRGIFASAHDAPVKTVTLGKGISSKTLK